MIQLRDDQQDMFRRLILSYQAGNKRVLVQAPTGWGKTPFAMKLVEHIVEKDLGIVWIVLHREQLIRQVGDFLASQGISFSHIYADEVYDPTSKVVLCTIQSISSKLKRNPRWVHPKLIIIDEAHRSVSKTYQHLLELYSGVRWLGLTATPKRLDGRPMSIMWQDLLIGPKILDLIKLGYLAEPSIYVPPKTASIIEAARSAWGTTMGDYRPSDLERTMLDNKRIYGDVLSTLQTVNPTLEPTIVFCTSIKHAHETAKFLNENGVKTEAIDGTMSDRDRADILNRLRSKVIHCVTSCDLITEGFDFPDCFCVILLRPTKSLTVYLQACGRSMRPSDDKHEAIIIDHVNNSGVHGAPWINRNWILGSYREQPNKKIDERGVSLKLCLRCGNYVRSGLTQCSHCGYCFDSQRKKQIVVPTKLVKVTVGTEIMPRLETYDDAYEFGSNKGWSDEFCHKFAEGVVQKNAEVKRLYASGTQEQLEALFVSEKKTPEQARTKALEILARRKEKVNDEQYNLYKNGTFSQLKAYFSKKGAENPERAANGILKRTHADILEHGTEEQLRQIGREFYEVTSENIDKFVAARMAKRNSNGSTGATTGPRSTESNSSRTTERDRFSGLVWFAKSGKLKEGVLDDVKAARFARDKMQKENAELLMSGSEAEVLSFAKSMHFNDAEAVQYTKVVLGKRGVKVAV